LRRRKYDFQLTHCDNAIHLFETMKIILKISDLFEAFQLFASAWIRSIEKSLPI